MGKGKASRIFNSATRWMWSFALPGHWDGCWLSPEKV